MFAFVAVLITPAQSDSAGPSLEADDGPSHEQLPTVSELMDGVKDLERKVANLFMDNVALTTKLKASRVAETETWKQSEEIRNLKEQLLQALQAEVIIHFCMVHSHKVH